MNMALQPNTKLAFFFAIPYFVIAMAFALMDGYGSEGNGWIHLEGIMAFCVTLPFSWIFSISLPDMAIAGPFYQRPWSHQTLLAIFGMIALNTLILFLFGKWLGPKRPKQTS